ncbi:MAG: hypothetical protein DRO10_01070 [Thermoprotei archaeon]|nr:MAG: hypothetical protein DRO10_01070 [Thermoprotei archaeon]
MIKDKEIIKERIISAAMKIFSRHGFFKAPIHLIAEEAGVSKGLVFWYFRSKEELIIEVAKRSLPLEIIDSCLESGLTGEKILECIGKGYMRKYRDSVQRNLLLHTMALESLYKEIAEGINSLCEEKTREVAEKVFGKSTINEKVALRAFFGGLLCYILRRPKDMEEEVFLRSLINMVIDGFKKENSPKL